MQKSLDANCRTSDKGIHLPKNWPFTAYTGFGIGAEKPEAQISDSLTNAVIRTCDMCHAGTGGNLVQAGAIDSREVRRMLDVWWRFNLVTGNADGYSNAFADGYLFESF